MKPKRYADLTLAYTETSGGIRTYIDQKRSFLLGPGGRSHALLIPGAEDRYEVNGGRIDAVIKSPLIPGCEPYRFFWRTEALVETLRRAEPDVIELGSFFTCPWAAFKYRAERHRAGKPCLVNGYFHTDLAEAYFGGPFRKAMGETLDLPLLGPLGEGISHLLESGAESYFGSILDRCDLVFAATEVQAARVREYGVDEVEILPLGVDIETFHPRNRSGELRNRIGASPGALICLYAGRLDAEKEVMVLVEALEQLHDPHFHLVVVGEGPLREELEDLSEERPHLHILPYEKDKAAFARLLASADLYVTAGPHETFGLSVVEAQASGLAVIGVNAGALRERIDPAIGRLVPPGDPTAFAAAIRELAPQARDTGARARAHIESGGFTWTDTFQKMLQLCDRKFAEPIEMD